MYARALADSPLFARVVLPHVQGYAPPGLAGEVLRNNQRHGIDATPLFYTEVESLVPEEWTSGTVNLWRASAGSCRRLRRRREGHTTAMPRRAQE